MAATTDNSIDLALRVPRGAYVVNKQATDMFPFLKDLASKYPVPKKDLAGGVNISATEGETFVPQEMVDDVGLGNLEFFNNKPKEGGHQSIDGIIAFETLQNIKPVSNGGEIQLDNFMGGGPLMNYENGGQTPEMDIRRNTANLRPSPYMRYERVEGAPMRGEPLFDERRALTDMAIKSGNAPNWFRAGEQDGVPHSIGWKDYVESGQGNMRDEMLLDRLLRSETWTGRTYDKSKADIDNLNFLAKKGYQLDEEETQAPVKKLMDALSEDKSLLNNIRRTSSFFNKQNGGLTGMENGGSPRFVSGAQPVEWNYDDPEMLRALFSVPAGQVGEGEGLRYYSAEKPYTQLANLDRKVLFNRAVQGMADAPQDSVPSDMVENYFESPKKGGFLRKLLGMQQGGPLPKGSTAEKTPNPFVPFDQRPNQDTASGRWGEPGAYMRSLAGVMDSLNMEDSIMTHKKGQNFLNKLRIKSMLNGAGTAIENPRPEYIYDGLNRGDTIQQDPTMRDLNEYFNSQLMQGRDSAAIEQGRQYRRPFPGY